MRTGLFLFALFTRQDFERSTAFEAIDGEIGMIEGDDAGNTGVLRGPDQGRIGVPAHEIDHSRHVFPLTARPTATEAQLRDVLPRSTPARLCRRDRSKWRRIPRYVDDKCRCD